MERSTSGAPLLSTPYVQAPSRVVRGALHTPTAAEESSKHLGASIEAASGQLPVAYVALDDLNDATKVTMSDALSDSLSTVNNVGSIDNSQLYEFLYEFNNNSEKA